MCDFLRTFATDIKAYVFFFTAMNPIQLHTEHLQQFVSASDLANIHEEVISAKETLLSRKGEGSDFLGWIDLPETITAETVTGIKQTVSRLATKVDLFVVVGIGGSYLGARAVIEALQSEFAYLEKRRHPLVIYAGHTLSEDYYHQLLRTLDSHDYAVAVISKSGTTTEPAVAFRIIKNHLEKKYGKDNSSERIIAITDAQHGALHNIAQQEGYQEFVIPDNIGGRFSVLTPVGLLPIAIAGYDIDKILQGACYMRDICIKECSFETNPALLYAAARNILYRKGRKVEILENFVPNLKYFSEWWKQLFGESEGKSGKGILPHSLSYTTDLHSMGQYVQEGERLMFETVISVTSPCNHVSLPPDSQNLDGINYLLGKSLTEINQKAELGTILAHVDGGVPVLRIAMPQIDEHTIGQLIYFFEFACGVSGYILGVNPFDQPGVEAYKKNMFRLLGKPAHV